jgi:serine/threonine protein kinase
VLRPGEHIQYFGNCELIEEVGLGGMGIVRRARQSRLDRIVALKMIGGGILADADDVKRFHAEARAAAQLQHPNIVAIHEIGEHEGQHHYSMDFVDGENLADLCDGKPLPSKQAAELTATIADAVQFAHQRGILHRDLKPQNVMIDAKGVPHLTDFGLAKRMDLDSGLTQTGAVMGSPSYVAPEQAQARHDRIGTHTDVYSLGAILYELLTGCPPFKADSLQATLMKVASEEPMAPRKTNPNAAADARAPSRKPAAN